MKPTSPLAIAREYESAEDYADAMNIYSFSFSDPPHLKDRAEQEFRRLTTQWNLWKQIGSI
jgi:hypothetical protein